MPQLPDELALGPSPRLDWQYRIDTIDTGGLQTGAAGTNAPTPATTTGDAAMTVKLGVLALLEAKPGKGDELGAFLESGRALAAAEDGTVTWYAFKITSTTYGIFDTFETEEARRAHLEGAIPNRFILILSF